MLRYEEIFVPGGFPRHTYNPRVELGLEARLGEVKGNLCKLVTLTGQTKSGKTVLSRKILPQEECVWIDGGTVSDQDDLWSVVINQLELFQTTGVDSSSETTSEVSGRARAATSFLVVKGEGEVGGTLGKKRKTGGSTSRELSSRVVALAGLREAHIPLVIDDFHYLPRDLQGDVVLSLKPLIFDGLPVAIIAIPHRRYDAVKVEREMTGRISNIEIPIWTDAELRYIPKAGFDLLGYRLTAPVAQRLASEAIGSPHLIQDFCRGLCRTRRLEQSPTPLELNVEDSALSAVFRDVAESIGRPIFDKLARGPRQRTDRLQRELKDGRKVDIYELVLHALAEIRPGLVSLEYEELRAAIRNVSKSQIPQLQEVARVLKHMATIAASDQSSTPVIDFEEEDRKLHITDPFFAFYLRWGSLFANGPHA